MNETIALTKEYGNYASYCMLACGNEPSGRWVEWVTKFVEYWEKKGSQTCIYRSIGRQRMAMATPQPISCKGRGTWPDLSRRQHSTQDDYRFQNHLDTVKQPYVSHETGQWCAFPNFNEIRKYTGVNKAKNFEIFKDILADNHMSDQAHLL